jgi:hypothetical protein
MVQENEIVMLLLGIGVLIFTLNNLSQLKRIPKWRILIWTFHTVLGGWLLTVLESFFWNELLNLLEHTCYAVSSVLMAVWCWKVFGAEKEAN